jgi:hypothetical protein
VNELFKDRSFRFLLRPFPFPRIEQLTGDGTGKVAIVDAGSGTNVAASALLILFPFIARAVTRRLTETSPGNISPVRA